MIFVMCTVSLQWAPCGWYVKISSAGAEGPRRVDKDSRRRGNVMLRREDSKEKEHKGAEESESMQEAVYGG